MHTAQQQSSSTDIIELAIQTGRLLTTKEVSEILGFKTRTCFLAFVARERVPHYRLSPKSIRFPAALLKTWLMQRSNTTHLN